jgi:RNA polymerase sigma-70 factor (ECF subfamily)
MQLAERQLAAREHDAEVVAALRRGDEAAFAELVDTYTPALTAVALRHVGTRAVAEEVVQDTWIAFIRGLDLFEQRSSVKTWLFSILINVAMSRARRERRSVPFSSVSRRDGEERGATVDPERFIDEPNHRWQGHWAAAPEDWSVVPERRLLARETLDGVRRAIDSLPERQRQVIALRDIEGWSAEEVCEALELSEANQRVLLHRARAKVRTAIERELDGPAL